MNQLIMACAKAQMGDSDNARNHLEQARISWPLALQNAGQFVASAPKGLLWYDEADTLLSLKNRAETALEATPP